MNTPLMIRLATVLPEIEAVACVPPVASVPVDATVATALVRLIELRPDTVAKLNVSNVPAMFTVAPMPLKAIVRAEVVVGCPLLSSVEPTAISNSFVDGLLSEAIVSVTAAEAWRCTVVPAVTDNLPMV